MTRTREQVSLVLSWITLIGSVGTFVTGAALMATDPHSFITGLWLWITGISSFYCSYTLRKIIVSEITKRTETV